MVIFDANVILRYLMNDNEAMAEQAERYLNEGDVSVTVEVVAEVVYVLNGVYALDRKLISKILRGFLALVDCHEKAALNLALETFGIQNLDFVDCVLYAYHKVKGVQIATFDKKLLKLMETT